MADAFTPGALSQAELLDLWTAVVDELYAQPLLEQGDGFGLEAHTQLHAQLERASKAVDLSTQALFTRDWSGQTSASAQGEATATVTLTLARTGLATKALTLLAGKFTIAEQTTDYGESAGVVVLTGRQYILSEDVTFDIGDLGPHDVQAQAMAPGFGFNNPVPHTLVAFVQPGTGFSNNRASVRVTPTTVYLDVENQPDVVIPDHVGQYVEFTAGANAGEVRQIIGYVGPNLDVFPPTGGTAILDSTVPLTAETTTAAWKILDWSSDWGLTSDNVLSPEGGRAETLDTLGEEKNIRRAPGEPDDLYKERISQIADVVTPNAIIRAANRVLAAYGQKATLREVGTENLPGFYFDGDPFSTDPANAYAYDMDFAVRPQDSYKVYLDYTEFRGFFVVSVPRLDLGDFGIAYDAGLYDAWDDISPYDLGFDGYGVRSGQVYRQIYQAIDKVRAGGVGFDLVIDPQGI